MILASLVPYTNNATGTPLRRDLLGGERRRTSEVEEEQGWRRSDKAKNVDYYIHYAIIVFVFFGKCS